MRNIQPLPVIFAACLSALLLLILNVECRSPAANMSAQIACEAFGTFKEFQTLATGALALVAAWVAAQPVWAQLASMTLQSDIASRSIIDDRLRQIMERHERCRSPLSKANNYFDMIALGNDDEFSYEIGPLEADNATSLFGSAASALRAADRLRGDTTPIETTRDALLSCVEAFQAALSEISLPVRLYNEPEATDDDHEQAALGADLAIASLGDLHAAMYRAEKEWNFAFDREVARIRERIRGIDDLVVDKTI